MIKCGALCEAAVYERLCLALPSELRGEPLERHVTAAQRLSWLKHIRAIEPGAVSTIKAVAALQNHVVHDIRQSETFSLARYFEELSRENPRRLDSLLSELGWENKPSWAGRTLGLSLFQSGNRAFLSVPLIHALVHLHISFEGHDLTANRAARIQKLLGDLGSMFSDHVSEATSSITEPRD